VFSHRRLGTDAVSAAGVEFEPVVWSDWSHDPYPLYRMLRNERPVYYDAPNDRYVVTRYQDASMVLSTADRFSNRYRVFDGERTVISPLRREDAPRHTFLRRIVMPMFTPGEMRRLEPYFRDVVCELLDAAERDQIVEVSAQLATPLPGRVTCDLLGLPLEQHARFLNLTNERQHLSALSERRAAPGSDQRTADDLRDDMWEIVGPIVEMRGANPKHDAISLLAQAQKRYGRDELGDGLIIDILLQLLTAGFHTTQHLTEMLISLLADRDDLWKQLRADRSLVLVAIEEMLRFDAPVQSLPRRAVGEQVVADTVIPADAAIDVVFGSANRDERAFEDPDTYRLDRLGKRHMAFSAGVHYCPGAPVSRFEVRALLNEMLDRYETIERAGPSEPWPINDQRTVAAVHGLRSVPIRLQPRSDGCSRPR
jgi:cytochrome P450